MILIHKLKKIKLSKAVRETIIDSAFFTIFFVFGAIFVFSKIGDREERATILINDNEIETPVQGETVKTSGFVASSRGKYYYTIGSNRANSLNEGNKIYFSSEEEAKKQGFKPYSGN